MIPLSVPNLSGNEAAYLEQCVETNFVSSIGPFVERFESDLAGHLGLSADRAVALSSGSAGLHAALVAVGVGHGDLVVLPTFTFIASANAISHCGASPWLMDIAPGSWTLDPEALGQALESQTEERAGVRVHRASGRRVAAIMPVYTLGLPADMDPIVAIARDYRLPVVADGAACLGARYRDQSIGRTGADLTVFSFNGNKTVTAGGGGAVVGEDEALTALVRHLTTTARTSSAYEHDLVGFNYRLTNLQAAVGCAQLEQLDSFVASKRRIATRYDQGLCDLEGIEAFPSPEWGSSACWLSGVRIHGRELKPIVAALAEAEIQARLFWRPIHLQIPYRDVRDAPREATPVSDSIWQSILTLPCSTHLDERDQDRVIEALRSRLE